MKTSKTLAIIKQSGDFTNLLSRLIRTSTASLQHVIRDTYLLSGTFLPLALTTTYIEKCGPEQCELVVYISCDYYLIKYDNDKVCYCLEESIMRVQHASSIKPCQRKKKGRGSWLSLLRRRSGKDKLNKISIRQTSLLATSVVKLKVTTPYFSSLASIGTPSFIWKILESCQPAGNTRLEIKMIWIVIECQ